MKPLILAAAAMLAVSGFAFEAASAQGRVAGARVNAAGGITAGSAQNQVGPNGGRRIGARGVATDGQGNAAAGSASCAAGAAGRACRASRTTVNADGSVNRQSGAVFQGADGGAGSTTGAFTRNPDGTYSGARSTNATGAQGNSYAAETTYDSATGVNRTVTCTNAAGQAIACPTR